MKKLPNPKTYELEFKYMPWGKLINELIERITKNCPEGITILDLMCGPGYLLGKIKEKRSELTLVGLDIDKRYINYAKKKYKNIKFIQDDALAHKFDEKYELILCTAGLHHLPYKKHEEFIKKISNILTFRGRCILAEPIIDNFNNEKERKFAASKLGCEYIKEVIKKDAPKEIIEASIDIMNRDIMPDGEYKTSLKKLIPLLKRYFPKIEVKKIWPNKGSDYGDYYFILHKSPI